MRGRKGKQWIFSVQEVARLADISVQAVYQAWHKGKFPTSSKSGRIHVIRRHDVREFLKARGISLKKVEDDE